MNEGSDQGLKTQLRKEHLLITEDGEEVLVEFQCKYSTLPVGAENQHTNHFGVI